MDECIREVLRAISVHDEIDVDTERDKLAIRALMDGADSDVA